MSDFSNYVRAIQSEFDLVEKKYLEIRRILLNCDAASKRVGGFGVEDCVDNNGERYQSDYLSNFINEITP